jgi:hypothetical protein
MKPVLIVLALCFAAASAYAEQGQVYKWTDAGGVVHYSDAPPPKDVTNVQTVKVSGGDRPRSPASSRRMHPPATAERSRR